MIGVQVESTEEIVVREFFELFKIPWEIYREDGEYDVVLCAGEAPEYDVAAKLVIVYASELIEIDSTLTVHIRQREGEHTSLTYKGDRVPIYGDSVRFPEIQNSFLKDERSGEAVAYKDQTADRIVCRLGYNLFAEVRTLLTVGQPVANAGVPTLELHIALLRDLITENGLGLVEIPPVPDGYRFIVCLTHDVDHPSIRLHGWDHTTLGFLYRAIFGSARRWLRGRLPARDLLKNWSAALRLPLVQMGLAEDFWLAFAHQYSQIEQGLPSTFFVIPFGGRSGTKIDGAAPDLRAAGYGAQQIKETIGQLLAAGCEVGLHGIDAWTDSGSGREEKAEIQRLIGGAQCGVRMHWLYYDQNSPSVLEKADLTYDSTSGYNETVGYRAGTTQVFKPFGTQHLLELPLHVMDTALFYPAYQDYSPAKAAVVVEQLIDNAMRFGGCLTINWHDRSVAPERLWDSFYRDLLDNLKSRGAWFATAGQVVAWFRVRRCVKSEGLIMNVQSDLRTGSQETLPSLQVRSYEGHESREPFNVQTSQPVEIPAAGGWD